MTTLQEILLEELNPQHFSEFDTIIAKKIDGEFSLESKASFAVKSSRTGLDFPCSEGEYWFFVTWYGSIWGHKSTKSLSGKRFN